MAKLETEHVFDGAMAKVFVGIKQFEKYPQYLPAVDSIKILPATEKGSTCQVRYELNIIKKFYYILNMYEESPGKMWWTLAESNIMKTNDGGWKLSAKGESQTKALYTLDIKFKGLVPSAITDQVAKANMPAMLAGFQKLINDQK